MDKNTPIRKKDTSELYKQHYSALSNDMKGFLNEAYENLGITFTITSGKREPKGRFSHHHSGDAIDFKANEFENYNTLYNTRAGLELLNKYGLGIIDETDPDILAKTKGTGQHFHIGKDSFYNKKVKERLSTQDIPPAISYIQKTTYPKTEPSFNQNVPTTFSNYTDQEFNYKQAEKEIIKADKQEDEDRKELTTKNLEATTQRNIQQEFLQALGTNRLTDSASDLSYSNLSDYPEIEEVNISELVYNPSQFIYNV